MAEHVYPAEMGRFAQIEANTLASKRWTPMQVIEYLKPKARASAPIYLSRSSPGNALVDQVLAGVLAASAPLNS